MATDYYELLGVSRNASPEELKRSYRRLARELHPDANGGSSETEERFKEVVLAYETLSDPERRRRYDMFGPEGARGPGGSSAEDVFSGGFGDLFDAFFGNAGGGQATSRGGPARGRDVEITLELPFEEAVFGAQREVKIRVAVTCSTCEGSGAAPGTSAVRCSTCNGAGEVRRVRQSILGQVVTASVCPACRGAGQSINSPCRDCHGEGLRTEERSYVVDVPAGVDEGSTLRLTNRGAAGPRGGPPGDLYVHLKVLAHPVMTRVGYDLHIVRHVAMTQAALGADVTVETLDGEESLTLPPGTQTGKIFRLRGRGVPHVQGRGRGETIVEIVVDTPADLNPAQEELLRQLAVERNELLESSGENGLFSRFRSRLH